MRKIFILALWITFETQGQLIIKPDQIEINAIEKVVIKINGIAAITANNDSVIVSSIAGIGTRFLTATPTGRLSYMSGSGLGLSESGLLPVSGTITIPAVAFETSGYTNVPVYEYAKGEVYFKTSVSEVLRIPLLLPDKVNISSILTIVGDNSPAANLKVTLYQMENNSAKSQILAVAKSAGNTQVYQTLSLLNSAIYINNAFFNYYLTVEPLDPLNMPGKWQGADLVLKNVLINYQY